MHIFSHFTDYVLKVVRAVAHGVLALCKAKKNPAWTLATPLQWTGPLTFDFDFAPACRVAAQAMKRNIIYMYMKVASKALAGRFFRKDCKEAGQRAGIGMK